MTSIKSEQLDELIEWNENEAGYYIFGEDMKNQHVKTAQALRQLKQLQETEPLRTEIIEKYNDGYEHGLRRAAEIIQSNLDGSMGVDDMIASILNEANNQ